MRRVPWWPLRPWMTVTSIGVGRSVAAIRAYSSRRASTSAGVSDLSCTVVTGFVPSWDGSRSGYVAAASACGRRGGGWEASTAAPTLAPVAALGTATGRSGRGSADGRRRGGDGHRDRDPIGEPATERLVAHLDLGHLGDLGGHGQPRRLRLELRGDEIGKGAVEALLDHSVERARLGHGISVAVTRSRVNATVHPPFGHSFTERSGYGPLPTF